MRVWNNTEVQNLTAPDCPANVEYMVVPDDTISISVNDMESQYTTWTVEITKCGQPTVRYECCSVETAPNSILRMKQVISQHVLPDIADVEVLDEEHNDDVPF